MSPGNRPADPTVTVAGYDAGAGYAGLQHLMLLRPDLVKLDRSLVACDRDPAKGALIEMLGRFTGQLDAWVRPGGAGRPLRPAGLRRRPGPLPWRAPHRAAGAPAAGRPRP
jgi:hypothetical protein